MSGSPHRGQVGERRGGERPNDDERADGGRARGGDASGGDAVASTSSPGSLPPLAVVVAIARGGVIGKDGGLPWHLPEDLRHFRAVTRGHAVIMGRKTYESIGRPLRDRRNLVVSRTAGFAPPGVEVFGEFDAALRAARSSDPEPRVIGGAMLYAAALPRATVVWLTEIDREVPGDTYFPPLDTAAFREVERRRAETASDVCFVRLERVPSRFLAPAPAAATPAVR
jgi:dihydrofolate reductase